jgi:hypothetical protein
MQDAPRPIISNGVPFKNQHIACNFTQSVREDAEDLIPPEEDLLFPAEADLLLLLLEEGDLLLLLEGDDLRRFSFLTCRKIRLFASSSSRRSPKKPLKVSRTH